MEMGDCMEEMKMISNVGYEIGKKAKLHDFEILRLFEFIKYDQYHEFFKQITSIASPRPVPPILRLRPLSTR